MTVKVTVKELNLVELVAAIRQIIPDADEGLVRGMLRIYHFQQRRPPAFRQGATWVLDESPEGKISEHPRRFAEVKECKSYI